MKIGILLGDDIGPEVAPECVKVMKAAAGRESLAIEWVDLPIGARGHDLHGNTAALDSAGPRLSAKLEMESSHLGDVYRRAKNRFLPSFVADDIGTISPATVFGDERITHVAAAALSKRWPIGGSLGRSRLSRTCRGCLRLRLCT